METKKRYTLFISYRHSDNASGFVSKLVDKLRTRFGADSVFFDEDDLESEKSFPEELKKGVLGSYCFVPILTKNYVNVGDSSGWCFYEALEALKGGLHIVPIALPGYADDIYSPDMAIPPVDWLSNESHS